MTSPAAEVLVKLVVDSNAPKATADLKHGLEKANKESSKYFKISSGLKAVEIDAAALALGIGAGLVAATAAGGAAIIGLAAGATYAFLESEKQVRALTGALTLLDSSGIGFVKLHDVASDLKDELEDTAMQVGATDDALVAAFTDVIERGGKSIDQAQKLTEEMAKAGRAVPGGIGTLSGAFEMIEMGAVRAKNPIVGMIAATHLLQGNAKQVAKQMQAMAPEEQMKLAEKAIANMAKKMDEVPMSIEEMSTSMRVYVGNLFEDAGAPIVKNLVPIFAMVRSWLMDNSAMLKSVARVFGEGMGKVVEVALPIAESIMEAIRMSSDEIRKTFNEINGPGKELFSYIYENKDAFAEVIGDATRALIKGGLAFAKAVSGAVETAYEVFAKLATVQIMGKSMFGTALPGLMAAQQERKARDVVLGNTGEAGPGRKAKLEELKKSHGEAVVAAHGDLQEANANFDKIIQEVTAAHVATMDSVGNARIAAEEGNAEKFAEAYDLAARQHDADAMEYAASFLKGNEKLQKALVEAGPAIINTGFSGLIDQLDKMGASEIAKNLTGGVSAGKRAAAKIGGSPNVNQYIGTVNVKQDFKDIDPERVAIVFRNDLAKHGVARLQPLGAKAFGS